MLFVSINVVELRSSPLNSEVVELPWIDLLLLADEDEDLLDFEEVELL